MKFQVGNKVFLNVIPIKGALKFGKKGKFRLLFVGPFEILERIGIVAYQLALLLELTVIDNVFRVSVLRNNVHGPNHVVCYQIFEVQKDLPCEEISTMVLDRKVYQLRNREVPLVKVKCRNHELDGSNWKKEEEVKAMYPELFH